MFANKVEMKLRVRVEIGQTSCYLSKRTVSIYAHPAVAGPPNAAPADFCLSSQSGEYACLFYEGVHVFGKSSEHFLHFI